MESKEAYLDYLNGNELSIEVVINEFLTPLLFFVLRYVRNISDAEDIVENVFFKLAVRKPKFKNEAKFSTWLYAIARNEAVSFLRKNKRFPSDSLEDYTELSDGSSDIEKLFLKEEKNIIVHKALDRLPDAYREVIHLSYFSDMKNDEIAKILKKSRKQVENLLYRAKLSLRKELEKEGFNNENYL